MKYLICILLILPFILRAETVTFDSPQNITEPTDNIDFTAAGTWQIYDTTSVWKKTGKQLYPDSNDISAAISTSMANVKTHINTYIKEAVQAGKYSIRPKGLNLSSVTTLDWYYICIEQDKLCRIAFKDNNIEYLLTAFPDLSDETAAAATARTSLNTELSTIANDVEANSFHE